MTKFFLIIGWFFLGYSALFAQQQTFSADTYAQLALDCVHQEYPNKISHVLNSSTDAQTPKALYPAFYGCFDWHSAVHGHWQLVRFARQYSDSDLAPKALAAIQKSITTENIATEVAYLKAEGRNGFERPYGLAWLFQLHSELIETNNPLAETLEPLVQESKNHISTWLPKLLYPIRVGEHTQTAFAFGLMLDWARTTQDQAFTDLLVERSKALYINDKNCQLSYEPSGQDFLSPCIAEADLMRRVLTSDDYSAWLAGFLPTIGQANWLPIAKVSDREDGKLAHLDGLNLSRAWMLAGMAAAVSSSDPRHLALLQASKIHETAGLEGISSGHYAGQHWLGSFAMYLETRRGIK